MKWFDYILAAGLGTVLALMAVREVRSEELSEIDNKLAAYCALYSREMLFIEVMHPTRSITADTDVILELAKKEYGDCLAVLPTLLPLPVELGSLKEWLADMRDLVILRAGRKPASDPPAPANQLLDDVAWRAQCAAEYRTWNADTGTVVRGNGIGEVRCPCGSEVTCANPQ